MKFSTFSKGYKTRFKTGDIVTAKCIGIDEKGRVKMSRRAVIKDKERKLAEAEQANAASATEAAPVAQEYAQRFPDKISITKKGTWQRVPFFCWKAHLDPGRCHHDQFRSVRSNHFIPILQDRRPG